MKRCAWMLLYLLLASSAPIDRLHAESRRAWDLTPAEHAMALRQAIARDAATAERAVTLTGRKDAPALFPVQLFAYLVRSYVSERPQPAMLQHIRYRSILQSDAAWSTFQALTADYAGLMRQMRAGTRQERTATEPRLRAAEATALKAVRAHFGRSAFDSFLYQTVAEGYFVTYTEPPSEEEIHSVIRREEAAQ